MAIEAFQAFWTYSNAPGVSDPATDPLTSIGGLAPVGQASNSRPYRPANTDSPFQVGSRTIVDTQAIGVGNDPAVGDWYLHMLGANATFYAKVESIDVPGTRFTLDRPVPNTMVAQSNYRSSSRENVFDNVTAAQMVDGLEDYRLLYFIWDNGNLNFGFRFYIEPIIPNGCEIEIAVPGRPPQVTPDPDVYLPADRFTDPFEENGTIKSVVGATDNYFGLNQRTIAYTPESAIPPDGTLNRNNTDQWMGMWIKRTVPPGAGAGECAFVVRMIIDDPTAQDATVDPPTDPFQSGFIMSWHNEQPTYTATIAQDRFAYQRGAARLTATVVDDRGVPAQNINAWFEVTGGGSVPNDRTMFTDENGQISTVYTSPDTVPGSDPVITVRIPENTEA